ncbi:MAG: hypothetical protein JXR63_11090 [Spirochaetales bacterium]|nr:hypothetical protein [Spirochaetales bacterium]
MKKFILLVITLFSISFFGFSEEVEKDQEAQDAEKAQAAEEVVEPSDAVKIQPFIPRFIISVKYPFTVGTVPDFFYNQLEGVNVREYSAVNAAIDIHLMYPFLDHLLLTGGLTFGSSNIFPEDPNLKVDALFSMMHLRLGLGGGFRALDWLQFSGGLEIGFFHIGPGGFYALNSFTDPNETKDRTVMGFSMTPFVALDFLVSKTIAITFKFDYQYGIVPKDNNLETGKIEHFHNPAISIGLGFSL